MGQTKVTTCPVEGLYVIEPAMHGDTRGYFVKTYNRRDMKEVGFNLNFVQDNQSVSGKGVLRGPHFQKELPRSKLVRVIHDRVFDVVADLRQSPKTFGQWYGVELTKEDKKQFYVSEGFVYGSLMLSNYVEFRYKVTDLYHPDDESGLAWNGPEAGIRWSGLVDTYPGFADASGHTPPGGTHLAPSDKDQIWEALKNTRRF